MCGEPNESILCEDVAEMANIILTDCQAGGEWVVNNRYRDDYLCCIKVFNGTDGDGLWHQKWVLDG
jgi:hypothetical protein